MLAKFQSFRTLTLASSIIALAGLATPVFAQAGGNERPRQRDGAQDRQGGQPGRDGGDRAGNRGGDRGGFGAGGSPFGRMFGGGGFGGGRGLDPSVSADDMARYSKIVNLSPDQTIAVSALHEAYAQQIKSDADTLRDKMDDLRQQARENQDFSGFQKIGEEMQKFRVHSQEMEASLFSDIKAVLTPDQAGKWPLVEQTHRREQSTQRGLMSGERVDLVKIVEGLELADADKVALSQVLEQYSADLDRELVARNKVQDDAQAAGREIFQNMDFDAAQRLLDQGRAASMRVRDVNARYARQIEPLLPEAQQREFGSVVQRQTFPQVYRPTTSSRWLEAAMKLPELTAEQHSTLDAVKTGFERDLGAINSKYQSLLAKREESWDPIKELRNAGPDAGFGGMRQAMQSFETDEMRTLREQRRTLDQSTQDKVKAALTPEQQAKLPEGRAGGGAGDDDGPGQRMRGGQGGAGDNPGQDRPRNRRRNAQPPANTTGDQPSSRS